MEQPRQPAAFLGRWFLSGSRSRQGQSEKGAGKARAHERLITKRCKSCQTLYQSAMRTAAVAALATFLAVDLAEAKQHSTLRVHSEASASSGPVFTTQIVSRLSGKTVTIGKVPVISERDVTGLQTYRAADGSYGALFQLNDHGRLALDSLSIERRGSFLFVFINGRPITELQIDRRVSDGKIYIASGLTTTEIELMKKDWPAKARRRQ
jgi:hypothetical protein